MRGRRPAEEKVVALAEEGAPLHNLEERARLRLEEIRPEGLAVMPRMRIFMSLAPAPACKAQRDAPPGRCRHGLSCARLGTRAKP